MTLNIRFSPETEAKLKERAKATGREVEEIVREAVENTLPQRSLSTAPKLSTEEWLKLWRQWVDSHPVRTGVQLNDSRESIYAGRG